MPSILTERPLTLTVEGPDYECWLCLKGQEPGQLWVYTEAGGLGHWDIEMCCPWLLRVLFEAGLITLDLGALKEAGMQWLTKHGVVAPPKKSKEE